MCNHLLEDRQTRVIERGSYEAIPIERQDLIRTLYLHAEEFEQQPYIKFVFRWMALNGWGMCVADTEIDRIWVDSVAYDEGLSDQFDRLLRIDADFERAANQFHDLWPIFKAATVRDQEADLGAPASSRREMVEHFLDHDVDDYEPRCWEHHDRDVPLDWPHTLCTLYRVRNNLFHGEKGLTADSNIRIVSVASDLLAQFVEKADLFDL